MAGEKCVYYYHQWRSREGGALALNSHLAALQELSIMEGREKRGHWAGTKADTAALPKPAELYNFTRDLQ